jgi:hypothetical protein
VFKKLFGKKNDGFFLQLDDEGASSKPAAKAKEQDLAQPKVATSAPAVATPAATTIPAPAAIAPEPVAKSDSKADSKKVAKEAKKAVAVVKTPEPVVAVPALPAISNFATDYLIEPADNSDRRRPGANMRGFMEMARQVEKPKAFKNTAAERKPAEKTTEKTVEKTVEK